MYIAFLSNANSVHLKEWSEHLTHTLGHRVVIFTIPRQTLGYDPQIEIVEIGNRLSGWKPGWLALIPRLRRELEQRRPDILVGYRAVSYGYVGALTGFRPYVIAPQSGDLTWPTGSRTQAFCVRQAVRRADAFNAWAPHIRDALVRFGADPAKITVLSRGIDLDLFHYRECEPPEPPRIVLTRALMPLYNIQQLIAAMPLIRREVAGASVDVVGDGASRNTLEEQARALGLIESVRFHGYLPRSELVRILAGSHIYVSTNITDGLPMSHFEAMAVGLFPILSDIRANQISVRHGENGLLFPLHDVEALARAVVQAWRDPELRERARRSNRSLVETEFDRDRCLARMAEGWGQLIAARRSRAL